MRITCDSELLKEGTSIESHNGLLKYISSEKIQIPYILDEKLSSHLDQMVVAANTFKADYEKDYDAEYGNDIDEQGYITGIELTLTLPAFPFSHF